MPTSGEQEEEHNFPQDPIKLRNYKLKIALLNFKVPEQDNLKNKELHQNRSGEQYIGTTKNTEKSNNSDNLNKLNPNIPRSSSTDKDQKQKSNGRKGLLLLDGNMKSLRSSLKVYKYDKLKGEAAGNNQVDQKDENQSSKVNSNLFREKLQDNTQNLYDKQQSPQYRDRYEDKQRNTLRLQSPLGQSLRSAQIQQQLENSQNSTRSQPKSILRNDSTRSQGNQQESFELTENLEQNHEVQLLNRQVSDEVVRAKKSEKQVKFNVLSSKDSSDNLSQNFSNLNKIIESESPCRQNGIEAIKSSGRSLSVPDSDSVNNFKSEILSTQSKQQFDELQAEYSSGSNSNREGKPKGQDYQLNERTSVYLNAIIQSSPNIKQLTLLNSQENKNPYRSRSLKDLDQAFQETIEESIQKAEKNSEQQLMSPEKFKEMVQENSKLESNAAGQTTSAKVDGNLFQQTEQNQNSLNQNSFNQNSYNQYSHNQNSYRDDEQQFLAAQSRSFNLGTPTKTSSRFMQESSGSFSSSVINLQKGQDSQDNQSSCKSPDLKQKQGTSIQNKEFSFSKNQQETPMQDQSKSEQQQDEGTSEQEISLQENANHLEGLLKDVNYQNYNMQNTTQEITTQDLLSSNFGKLQQKYLMSLGSDENIYDNESNKEDSNKDSAVQITLNDLNKSHRSVELTQDEIYQSGKFWQKDGQQNDREDIDNCEKKEALISREEISDFPNKMKNLSRKLEQEIKDLNKRMEEKQTKEKDQRGKLMLKGLDYYTQHDTDKPDVVQNKSLDKQQQPNTVLQQQNQAGTKIDSIFDQDNNQDIQQQQQPKNITQNYQQQQVQQQTKVQDQSKSKLQKPQSQGQQNVQEGQTQYRDVENRSQQDSLTELSSPKTVPQVQQYEGQSSEGNRQSSEGDKAPHKQDFYIIDSYYTFTDNNTMLSSPQFTTQQTRRRGSFLEDQSFSMESRSQATNVTAQPSQNQQSNSQIQQSPNKQQSRQTEISQTIPEKQAQPKQNDDTKDKQDSVEKLDTQSGSNNSNQKNSDLGKTKYVYSGSQVIYSHNFDKQNVQTENDQAKKTQSSRLDTGTSFGGQSMNPTKFLSMFDSQPGYQQSTYPDAFTQDSKFTQSSRDHHTQSSRDRKLRSHEYSRHSQIQFNEEPTSNYQSFQQNDSHLDTNTSSKFDSRNYQNAFIMRNNLASNKDSMVFQSGNSAKYLTSSFRDIYNVSQNTMRTGRDMHMDSVTTSDMEKFLVQKVQTQQSIEAANSSNANNTEDKLVSQTPGSDTKKNKVQQEVLQNKALSQLDKDKSQLKNSQQRETQKVQKSNIKQETNRQGDLFSNQKVSNSRLSSDFEKIKTQESNKSDKSNKSNENKVVKDVNQNKKDISDVSPQAKLSSTEVSNKSSPNQTNNNQQFDSNPLKISNLLFEQGKSKSENRDQVEKSQQSRRRNSDREQKSSPNLNKLKHSENDGGEITSISFQGYKQNLDPKSNNAHSKYRNNENSSRSNSGFFTNFRKQDRKSPEIPSVPNQEGNSSPYQNKSGKQNKQAQNSSLTEQSKEATVPKMKIQHQQSHSNPSISIKQQQSGQSKQDQLNSRDSEIGKDIDDYTQTGEKMRNRLFQRRNKKAQNFSFDDFERENQNQNQNQVHQNPQMASADFESLHSLQVEQNQFQEQPYQSLSQQSFRNKESKKGKNRNQQDNRHRAKLGRRLDIISNSSRQGQFGQLQSQDEAEMYRARMKCFKLF